MMKFFQKIMKDHVKTALLTHIIKVGCKNSKKSKNFGRDYRKNFGRDYRKKSSFKAHASRAKKYPTICPIYLIKWPFFTNLEVYLKT